MRLPDPFVDPTWPGVTSCLITDNSTYQQDELNNNSVIQVSSGAQYFSLTLEYTDLLISEYDRLCNFVAKVKRENAYIDVLVPQFQNLSFNLNTYLASNGLKGNVITIPNVTSMSGNLNINQFIQLSTHPKLYQITDYNYNSSSKVLTLNVYPDLFTTTNNSTVNFKTPMLRGRIKNINNVGISPLTTEGYYSNFSLEIRESNN